MSQIPDTSAIQDIFQGLLQAQHVEADGLYQAMKGKLDKRVIADPDGFHHTLIYPHEQFLAGLIRQVFEPVSNELVFLLTNSQFLDNHFSRLFERVEGRACSSDKASACIEILMHFFKTGEVVEFNYAGKYTYHLPVTILRTHAERLSFYQALKSLHYGRPDEYLQQLQGFIRPQAE